MTPCCSAGCSCKLTCLSPSPQYQKTVLGKRNGCSFVGNLYSSIKRSWLKAWVGECITYVEEDKHDDHYADEDHSAIK